MGAGRRCWIAPGGKVQRAIDQKAAEQQYDNCPYGLSIFGPPRGSENCGHEQHRTDSRAYRRFGKGHIDRPHNGPQKAHHETVGPKKYGGASRSLTAIAARAVTTTIIRMISWISHNMVYFFSLVQGFRPALTPASIMA